MRAMRWQVLSASGAEGLASGGLLAAFALLVGASNFHIGVMTAIPFVVQPLQIAAVIAVERWRQRKLIAVLAYFFAFASWIPIAGIPFLIDLPSPAGVALLLACMGLRGAANAFVNTSWSGWLRDLVPEGEAGSFFAQRMRTATAAAATAAIIGALYIDWWKGAALGPEVFGYSYAMLFGSIVLGFTAVGFMARIPEPRMPAPEGPAAPLLQTLGAPLRDGNFRQLLRFLFLRNFVANLAVPFFTVYMLTKLGMALTWVVGLGVLSQLSSVVFLRVWGPLVDRHGSKVILSLTTSLSFLVMLGWIFVAMPQTHALTVPLLILLHALIGIANAGINISSMTLRMKMAPRSQSTAYLTAASLAANLGAGISPLVGGAFTDFFDVRHLKVVVEWVDPLRSLEFPALFLTGFDFLFAIAFALGLLVLGVLSRVREEGETENNVVMEELMAQTRDNLRALNSVPGMSFISNIPVRAVRSVPSLPGLDVAVGVTVHQLSSSIRVAVETLDRGGATAQQLQHQISRSIVVFARRVGDLSLRGAEVGIAATRAAMEAAATTGIGIGYLSEAAVRSTLRVLSRTAADPFEALRGAVFGAVQGARDTGAQVGQAAAHAVQAARAAATSLGLSEREAADHAARAALEAAEGLDREAQAEVKAAVLDELLGKEKVEPGSKPS
jgi:MFS family permease